jgi:FkbM family methyltransferase
MLPDLPRCVIVTRMKSRIHSVIGKVGFDLHRLRSVPFGIRWEHDVHGLFGNTTRQLTIFDVGANVGQTAQRLVQVFPNSMIYSFEPVPETFANLQRNTAHLTEVECVNVALGEELGEATMTTDRDGQNTLIAGVSSSDSVTARVTTLDDFCADRAIHRVDLLKIDTEGFETFVLKGASEMLSQGSIKFVVAECDFIRRPDEPHGDFFEIYALLAPLGFNMIGLYTGGVDEHGWVWGDMLMMQEGAAVGMPVVCSPNWH